MKQPLVYISLITTIILWASAYVGIKVALIEYSPTHLSVFRFIVASITLVFIALIKKIQLLRLKDVPRLFLTGIIGISIYNIALNNGELTVTASATSFIINTVPMLTLLLSVVFLKEKIDNKAYIGTLLSFIGVGIIAFAESKEFNLNNGVLLIAIAAISQSLFFILQKPLLQIYSPLSLICYSVWFGTLCMLPLLSNSIEAISRTTLNTNLSVLYLGVFPGAIGYLTWTSVLSKMKAHSATVFLYLIPIVSLIIGIIWINEIPSHFTIIGGLFAIGGVIIFNLKKK